MRQGDFLIWLRSRYEYRDSCTNSCPSCNRPSLICDLEPPKEILIWGLSICLLSVTTYIAPRAEQIDFTSWPFGPPRQPHTYPESHPILPGTCKASERLRTMLTIAFKFTVANSINDFAVIINPMISALQCAAFIDGECIQDSSTFHVAGTSSEMFPYLRFLSRTDYACGRP